MGFEFWLKLVEQRKSVGSSCTFYGLDVILSRSFTSRFAGTSHLKIVCPPRGWGQNKNFNLAILIKKYPVDFVSDSETHILWVMISRTGWIINDFVLKMSCWFCIRFRNSVLWVLISRTGWIKHNCHRLPVVYHGIFDVRPQAVQAHIEQIGLLGTQIEVVLWIQ